MIENNLEKSFHNKEYMLEDFIKNISSQIEVIHESNGKELADAFFEELFIKFKKEDISNKDISDMAIYFIKNGLDKKFEIKEENGTNKNRGEEFLDRLFEVYPAAEQEFFNYMDKFKEFNKAA